MFTSKSETMCPWCGCNNEATTRISPGMAKPEEGNVSICFNCCGFSMFSDDGKNGLTLRIPTPQEDFAITHDEDLQYAQRKLIEMKRKMGK